MVDFLYGLWMSYGVFLLKTVTITIALIFILSTVVSLIAKTKGSSGGLVVTNLSEQYEKSVQELTKGMVRDKDKKAYQKLIKKREKEQIEKIKKMALQVEKIAKSELNNEKSADQEVQAQDALDQETSVDQEEICLALHPHFSQEQSASLIYYSRKKLFVLDFVGSIDAKEVGNLRREISAILAIAGSRDEVLLRLRSGGGTVSGYGLAAAQLERIKDKGLRLTVSVDQIAASGGYMMACVADSVIAAPFAMLGSIGVIAQMPNFHRIMKKNDIDYEQVTAGEYKRTMTIFGENTEQGREKLKEELEAIHDQFKHFVKYHRNDLDIDAVATGEVWLGEEAVGHNLVDGLMTSDQFIEQRIEEYEVFKVEYKEKKTLSDKLSVAVVTTLERLYTKAFQRDKQFYS